MIQPIQLLIKPLQLGNQYFSNNLIQGPLAGYSCAPLRVLANQYGSPAFCYTEMVSAKHLANQPKISPRFSFKDPQEGPLCFQLSGTEPEELAKAVEKVIGFGADLIDLNCGCPVSKIRQKGAGSKLLENPELLKKLILAMKSANQNHLPLSIKIRLDQNLNQNKNTQHSLTAALIAQEAGVDFITIHGRHWTEGYDRPCRVEDIAEIISKLNIPVIANGDASDTASTLSLLAKTGAAGVMIARASVGQPWLFQKIKCEAEGKIFIPPSVQTSGEIFLAHLSRLINLEGEKLGVLQSRKLIKYYARDLPDDLKLKLVEKAQKIISFQEMQRLVEGFFYIF